MMAGDRQTRNRFISHGYLARSRYADQLEWWVDAFGPEQLLVLRSEDLFDDPAAVLDRTCDFLGLPRFDLSTYAITNRGNRRRHGPPGRSRASCEPGSTTTSPSPTVAWPDSPATSPAVPSPGPEAPGARSPPAYGPGQATLGPMRRNEAPLQSATTARRP